MTSYTRIRWLLLGDSITQQSFSPTHAGWGAALADYYARTGDVTNRGYSGYNSRWLLENLPAVTEGQFPSARCFSSGSYFVTLFLGANDSSDDTGASLALSPPQSGQGVPLDEYQRNLHAIVSGLKERIDAACPSPPSSCVQERASE